MAEKINKRNVESITPLTALQEGMLYHTLANPGSRKYTEQFRYLLKGRLEFKRFKEAWEKVAEANDVLRAVFRWEKMEEPVQVVLKKKQLNLREAVPQNLEQAVTEERNEPVDISLDPIRITLFRKEGNLNNRNNRNNGDDGDNGNNRNNRNNGKDGNDESEMVITFHHILYDGWSNGILLGEFLETYRSLVTGNEPKVEPKTPNREFYKWYRQNLEESGKQGESFWRDALNGFDTRTQVPEEGRKKEGIGGQKTEEFTLGQHQVERLEVVAKTLNTTPSAVIYAAWGQLLQNYNNTGDVLYGTTVSGRTAEVKGIRRMVGMFINTLPLRQRTSPDASVGEVVKTVGNHLKDRSPFEHTPLTEIKRFTPLGKEGELFDTLVVIDNYPLERKQNEGNPLRVEDVQVYEQTNYDITVQVREEADSSQRVQFHYNAARYQPEAIKRMAGHYANILDAYIRQPEGKVSDIDMLTPEERKRILTQYNRPQWETVIPRTIHGIIEEQAERTPDNDSIRFEGTCLTYRQLNQAADRMARLLMEKGVTGGARVVLMFPRGVEMIVALLGILKAGAACIPLDTAHPEQRNRFIISDSGAGYCLKHPAVAIETAGNGITEIIYDEDSYRHHSPENPGQPVKPEDLSYIIYTSGSTGNPKGALLHHSGVVNHTETKIRELEIGETDVVANNFSINVIAAVWQILSPLFVGATLEIYSDEIEWDPYLQFRRVADDGVTVIEVIPSVLKAYLYQVDEGKEKIRFDGLRKIALTSEETKPFLVNKFYGYYSRTDLVDCYGMTETSDDVLHYTIPHDTETRRVPIGTPALNTRVLILNHLGQLQPEGIPGEICVQGAGVGYGYWNRPDLTAEKYGWELLRQSTGKSQLKESCPSYKSYRSYRSYKTGDLGRWLPGGLVEYQGRLDHQVKIRGNRVELREIENHITGIEAVKEAAVIAKEDREGDKNLYAFYVSDRQLTGSNLRRELLQTIPDYMVPAHFVQVDILPVTPNGKIDRKALANVEITGTTAIETTYIAPRNNIETAIRDIWAQLLDIEKDRLGMDDNYFDRGGHSLLLIKLKSKLEKNFPLEHEIPITDLFNSPTIALQARYIHSRQGGGIQNPVEKETIIPLETTEKSEIAIIGMSVRVPGASNVDEFWRNISEGIESITFFEEEQLESSRIDGYVEGDNRRVRAGGILGDVDMFDADFFGINPREAQMMDPQQRVFLEQAWLALEDAGYGNVADNSSAAVGVYAGQGMNTYLLNNVMGHPAVVNSQGEFQTMIGNDKDFLATRVAYKLNLKGPAITVQTACSTSLVAVHQAKQALQNGDCRMALAGGVFISIPEKSGYHYNEGGYLSPDGHCRSFDADAQGTVFGNGVGVVVMKPLKYAIKDNDQIYAVIEGSAVNNDGALKVGYTSPGEEGQATAIIKALKEASVPPYSVGYIETHGTGTVLGDPVEIAALTRAHRKVALENGTAVGNQYCAVGSVKANIGHLDTAAGVVGLIKAILCLKNKQIPPVINLEKPNPIIDFPKTPFYLNRELKHWKTNGEPRRAAVSSFGIGGTNAHVILEEPPQKKESPEQAQGEWQLFLQSAKTESALQQIAHALENRLREEPETEIRNAAYTLAVGRKAFNHRQAVVARGKEDAVSILESYDKRRLIRHTRTPGEKTRAFLFPGIGDHYIGMTEELYNRYPTYRYHLDRCSELLESELGCDIRKILFKKQQKKTNNETIDFRKLLGKQRQQSPEQTEAEKQINRTIYAHTSVFVVEYALAQLMKSWGIEPAAMMGYSLGEYTAATVAGVFALEDALKVVARRARLLDQVEPGAMHAVSLPETELRAIVEKIDGISIAAVNTPDLCIVTGTVSGIEILEHRMEEEKHVHRRLKTAQPFHSPLMETVRPQLEQIFADIPLNSPRIPIISNVTGKWADAETITKAEYWIAHTVSPIRCSEGIVELQTSGANIYQEIGPGNSMIGYLSQHPRATPEQERYLMATQPRESENVSEEAHLLRVLAKQWAVGGQIDWERFYGEEKDLQRQSLPQYPFERKRFWLEPQTENVVSSKEAAGRIIEKKEPHQWYYMPTWKQTVPTSVETSFEPGRSSNKKWLVFLDKTALGARQIKQLRIRAGEEAVVEVKIGDQFLNNGQGQFSINPVSPGDYDRLLEQLREEDREFDTIVHQWQVTAAPGEQRTLERGVDSLENLVRALARQGHYRNIDLWMVSNHRHRIESSDIVNPVKAAIQGPIIVVGQEYPNLRVREIDVPHYIASGTQTGETIEIAETVNMLQAEFEAGTTDRVVVLRGGTRWVRTYEPMELPRNIPDRINIRKNGVYLITGGTGKIGRTIADTLLQEWQASVVLLSRRPQPEKEPGSMRSGEKEMVLQADVSDKNQVMQAVVETERRFGPIDGVIHAAGIMDETAFNLIGDQEALDSRNHYRAKITGTDVLTEIFAQRELDFFLMTSSLSPILGGLSLYAYSAANSYMDAVALQQRINRKNWISVNWADWQKPEEENEDRRVGATVAALSITPEEGRETFKRILTIRDMPQIIISSGDLNLRIRQWATLTDKIDARIPGNTEDNQPKRHQRPHLQSIYEEPKNESEKIISEIWEELLGIEQVGVHDNFFELGGHSLIATRLISRMREIFQVDVPLPILFDHPTVREQVENIENHWGDPEIVAEIAQTYREVQAMD
jgi:polyketide synthase PksJ